MNALKSHTSSPLLVALGILLSSSAALAGQPASTPAKAPAATPPGAPATAPTAAPSTTPPGAQTPTPPAVQKAPVASAAKQPRPPTSHAAPGKMVGKQPALHHAPISIAVQGKPVLIRANIKHPEKIRGAVLYYRVDGTTQLQQAPFLRASKGPYLATIPANQVHYPGLSYAVALVLPDGTQRFVFSSPRTMFHVAVPEPIEDLKRRVRLQRLGGRRSVVEAGAEYVQFGSSTINVTDKNGVSEKQTVHDYYYRIESGYTYYTLGRFSSLSVKIGAIRGQAPVPAGSSERPQSVGLNYVAPGVGLLLTDNLSARLNVLTSVTELGFELGGGGELTWGAPTGSRMTFGIESVHSFGTRVFTRMDLKAGDTVTISPIVEITNMPHADDYGVRLLTDLGFDMGKGWDLAVRGGYQARSFDSGGPSAGLHIQKAF